MKSIVLLVWLLGSNGKEQLILNRHLDDQASCLAVAETVVAEHRQRGAQARYLCHGVVPENEEVDVNGNPIEP